MGAENEIKTVEGKAGIQEKKAGFMTVLMKNPSASVFLIFFGIHSGMNVVPYHLVIAGDLAAQVWGKSMTFYLVIFDAVRLGLGVMFAGPFGSLGDKCGNFLIVCIMLVLEVSPIISTLMLGRNEAGLISFCALRALAGVTGASLTSAPCMYAYSHELVSSREHYRLYTALIYGVTCSMTMAFFIVARRIDVAIGPDGMLWLGVALCGVQVLMLIGMRLPCMRPAPRRSEEDGNPVAADSEEQVVSETSYSSDGSLQEQPAQKRSVISWLRLVRDHPSLLRVCIISMMVCMAETVLHDTMGQYAFSVLDILTGKENGPKRRKIAFIASVTTWCAISASSMLMGWFQKLSSPIFLLKLVIIFVAIFQTLPVILMFSPTTLVLVVCCISVGSAFMALPILQALVPEVAPPGQTSEAIAAMAAFKNAAYLCTTIVLTIALPALNQSSLEHPLWVLFPVCGALALAAVPLAMNLKPYAPKATTSTSMK